MIYRLIPLRIAGIASALCFLCAGIFARSFPPIFLYSLLLPLNIFRLRQMMELIKKVRAAASSDLTMDWLEPFMKKRGYRKGDVLFRKGDLADEMFLAAKGKFLVSDLGIELRPGQILWRDGGADIRLAPDRIGRTAPRPGHVLVINYDQVRELYFENPEFGLYFLRLVGERLLHGIKRVEDMLSAERQLRQQSAS